MTTCGSHLDVSPGDELLLPAVPRVFPHVVRAVAGLTVAAAAHSAGVAVQLGDDLDDVGGAEGPGQRVPHLQHTLHSPLLLPPRHLLQSLLQLRGLVLQVGDPMVEPQILLLQILLLFFGFIQL